MSLPSTQNSSNSPCTVVRTNKHSLGVVVFFLIPRQPFISFEAPPRLSKKEDNHLIFSASKPTNFSFDAQLDLSLHGRQSYLPTLIRGLVPRPTRSGSPLVNSITNSLRAPR